MLYNILYRMMFARRMSDIKYLGRWNYHWDTYKDIQKYYD